MNCSYNTLLFVTVMLFQTVTSDVTEDSRRDNYTSKVLEDVEPRSRVLSRRKRYLVFPDGSSFQLVFCLQTSALIPIGDIFLFGNTAAMAWALPTDPDFFKMVKNYEKGASRRGDTKNEIFYIDKNGKVLAKVPYKRVYNINPVFTKRSVDEQDTTFKEKLRIKIDRMKMHENQLNRDFLSRRHMNEKSVEFHRTSRFGLYEKLEMLFSALGRDGRHCVLQKLCQAAWSSQQQGTFLQEFLRIVFTLPKSNGFVYEEHKEYDKVHTTTEDCTALYPNCGDSGTTAL